MMLLGAPRNLHGSHRRKIHMNLKACSNRPGRSACHLAVGAGPVLHYTKLALRNGLVEIENERGDGGVSGKLHGVEGGVGFALPSASEVGLGRTRI
jgi:hypothetical protein